MTSSGTDLRCNSSDEFVRLLIANQSQLYAYIVSLVPNWVDADEIFQECSMVLWSKRDEFAPGTSFIAWSCQIALNKVMNLRKRKSRGVLLFDDEFLKAVSDERLLHDDRLEARAVALRKCMLRLRAPDRDLLDHWYQRQGTTKDMAAEVGRPLDTVYKALKRIRTTLFECINRTLAAEESA
jgi:RNA polymerase sigma-70 factor, ECF subfamily